MASPTQWTRVWETPGVGDEQGGLAYCGVAKSRTRLSDWTELKTLKEILWYRIKKLVQYYFIWFHSNISIALNLKQRLLKQVQYNTKRKPLCFTYIIDSHIICIAQKTWKSNSLTSLLEGFPGGSVGKSLPVDARDIPLVLHEKSGNKLQGRKYVVMIFINDISRISTMIWICFYNKNKNFTIVKKKKKISLNKLHFLFIWPESVFCRGLPTRWLQYTVTWILDFVKVKKQTLQIPSPSL